MSAHNVLTQTTSFTPEEIKGILSAPGPCVTLILPIGSGSEDLRQSAILIKNALKEADAKLSELGVGEAERKDLVTAFDRLAEEAKEHGEGTLVVLWSRDAFRYFHLPAKLNEIVLAGHHFYVRPLTPFLRGEKRFYILALSQKRIRLLRCTENSSEEVPLPRSVPKSLEEALQLDKPDHVLDNRSASGHGTGSMRMLPFGTNDDKEHRDEYLHHFYKAVDHGLREVLGKESAPLVIAGVEYEIPIYRSVNTYQHIVDQPVLGAPDGLKGGELHKRALEVVSPYFETNVQKALEQFEEFGGTDRSQTNLKEIVKAAYEGRVAHLFMTDEAEKPGTFDEVSYEVKVHDEPQPGDEDLVNVAALQTMLHSGEVHLLPRNRMPKAALWAAVMRW